MKVWLLDNGSIVIEHTQLLWNVPGPQVRIPVYSVLVEHDDGLFLFDTGIDLDHMNRVLPFELPEQTPEQTIPAQLEVCGFSVSDVTTLVNSHLHIDHVGGNKLFPGTRNVIHAKEVAQARNHEPFEFFGYSDKSWDYEGLNLETVTGDVELAKGIFLYETPGHTVGHYSLLLKPERERQGRCCSPSTSPTPRLLWRRASSRASTTTRTTASARSAESRSSPPSTARRSSTRTTWTPGTPTATPPTATRSRGPR